MQTDTHRRRLLQWLGTATGLGVASKAVYGSEADDTSLFGEPEHRLVYQLNKADIDYMEHIMFSVGAMLRQHGDNIHMVVTAFGPGIHILARRPLRPVPELIRQRVASLAQYGVEFHACGNTLKSLEWGPADIVDFATIVEIGANDLMALQEQGYSYISW